MKNINEIINDQAVLEILSSVLENNATLTEISAFSPNGEKYGYNQYSSFIVIDFFLKYYILFCEKFLWDYCLEETRKIVYNFKNHQDLVWKFYTLLGNLVQVKLGLEDSTRYSNKRQILKYIYDQYIVNGYCFYSFSSQELKQIEQAGIDPTTMWSYNNDIKKLNYIFDNHNCKDILPDLKKSAKYVSITDSPTLAYFEAIQSPKYLCMVSSANKYMKTSNFDQEAFYRHDLVACQNNISKLCNQLHMSQKEQQTILKIFNQQWKNYNISNSKPCLAFVKREALDKNKIHNIESILKNCCNEELIYSIARILDSKYPVIRRYTPIKTEDFDIVILPSYEEIKNKEWKKAMIESSQLFQQVSKEIEEENNQLEFSGLLGFSGGYASVIALFGMLCISLGSTLLILLKYYGG